MGTLVRQMMEDTVLNGRRLSRRDGMIKMLNPVVHNDILNWGLDIDNTIARRFGVFGFLSLYYKPGKWVVKSLAMSPPHL